MPTKQQEKRCKNCKKIYCGNSEKLPKGYHIFGSRYQCLSRGIGVGLYAIPKSKSKEKTKEIRKKRRDDEELDSEEIKFEHKEFLDKNFKKALKKTKKVDTGQLFKQLAILWKAKHS